MTQIEFFKARLDEIEARARGQRAHRVIGSNPGPFDGLVLTFDGNRVHYGELDVTEPYDAWVETLPLTREAEFTLADVAAKRKVIELHELWPILVSQPEPPKPDWQTDGMQGFSFAYAERVAWLTTQEYRTRFGDEPPTGPIISALIQPFSDHPDFEEAWRQ